MDVIIGLIGAIAIAALVFAVTHLYPLTPEEVQALAQKRRWKSIRSYFSFDARQYTVDKGFKKRMNPKGAFYNVNEPLFQFPSLAAGLLKGKKHEWVIVALEKDSAVNTIWLNKGMDRTSVQIKLSVENISQIANQGNYTSVLVFHNHPNANLAPSERDIEIAEAWSKVLNTNGITLVEFVCGRGLHHEYFISPADEFHPLSGFLADIEERNGKSWLANLSLHFERVFG